MDKLRFFRSVCSWGHVLFAILKVISIIGAVFALVGVLILSFMPGGFVKVETMTKVDFRMEMVKLLGDDWKEHSKEMTPEDFGFSSSTVDEKGMTITETVTSDGVENRGVALSLIPTFAQLLLSFFLYRLIARVFKAFQNSADPFRTEIKEDLQKGGWLLMALGTAPAVCGSLISMITGTQGLASAEYDLFLVFSAFLVWAFSDLMQHGKSLLPVYPEEEIKKDDDINPNAF